jgi:phosphate transport system permease protein
MPELTTFYIKRKLKDKIAHSWMIISLIIVISLPLIIGAGLFYKSHFLLKDVPLKDIIFSSSWKPLSGKFGLLSFIFSSLWVTFISIFLAVPICLLSAIHLTQYAKKWVLKIMHPVLDILAGIPSVIYGIWGILAVVPFVQYIASFFGKTISGYSIMAGSIVLAVMIIPFILNIMVEVFRTIPEELTEAALSLGASKWQAVKKVLLKKAFPGIISAVGLGVSRAFGETIAVLMVVGNVIKIPQGVFDSGYPLPALIANNYGEMLSIPMYDSALMLSAFVLFLIVILFNILSRLMIVRFEKKL